ncbi:helix-turn-helix domain-containing protein [Flavobacterium sp. JP2137]|uniref:helix-turn-helix domain-containing protein n=1 Tax=Flavobacterium sp. JP2137 TaxID=3414510 RepID=UPI003D2FE58F
MKSKKQVIQVQQHDKNVPIEFFRIEQCLELFDFRHHYQYDFYQIFWFTQTGNQQQEIDFVAHPIAAHQIWIIYPGQVHHFDPESICGYYLAIDKDYFHRILFREAKQQAFTENAPLKFEVGADKRGLFEHLTLLIELEFSGLQRADVLERYLQLYLLHLQDLPLLQQRHVTIDARIHKLLELVERHYISERKNEFYADKVALSVKRMNEILLRSIGKSLKQQLQDRLLLEAKRLVGYSTDNIQHISHALGFSEVSYFNRFFKKLTLQTPLHFREQVKKVQG